MPIFSTIGTAIAGALFGGSALAGTLISSALAFGTKLAVSYLNRPKKRSYAAFQGEIQYGADIPVGAMYGIGKVKGHRVFYAKWGKGNKFNADVFILSNGWCDRLEGIYFYGEKQTLVPVAPIGGEAARFETTGFGNNLTIRFYDGRPGQTVDAKLVANTATAGRTWKSSSVCAGLCYVIVEREYDSRFEKGIPDYEFVLRGLRCYDPRKDSTVAGGSGPHRLSNPATWEFSQNPAVQRLNYQLGLRGQISGRTLIGEGKSMGQLDLSSYFAAMNVCDTIRNGKPTYQSALYVQGDDDHTEILKEFDDAMAGYGLNRRGLSGVIPGAPQIPVLTITAEDIPADRAQEIKRRKSAFDLYNMMSGQFTSIESNWSPESLKPILVNADIAADGRRRQTSNDFLQVTDPDIAQYLLNIRYRQNRKGGSATVPVSRRVGLKVQEGDWVVFDDVTWLVTKWTCNEKFQFTLTLAETGADVYSEAGIEPGPIIIPPSPPINPDVLTTVQGWAVEIGMLKGEDGFERPTLRFGWTPPEDPTITEVRFFYRIAGTTQEFEDKSTTPEKGEHSTSKDVQSGVFYEARATITTVPDRFKTYTPWLTTISKTGLETIYLPGLVDEVKASIREKLAFIQDSFRFAYDVARRLDDYTAEQSAQSFEDKKQITAAVGAFSAEYSEKITVVASDVAAAVVKIETLEAKVDDPETGLQAIATITNTLAVEVHDPGTGLQATANAVQAMTVTVGRFSANGLLRAEQVATQAGALSTMALSTSASEGSATSQAAMYLSAIAGGVSEMGVVADRFYVMSANQKRRPFIIQNGILYADELRVTSLAALSAVLGNVDISNAEIGNLIVGTSNLDFRAVTDSAGGSGTLNLPGGQGTAWRNIFSVTITNPNGNPVMFDISYSIRGLPIEGSHNPQLRVIHQASGAVVWQRTFTFSSGDGEFKTDSNFKMFRGTSIGGETYIYQVYNDRDFGVQTTGSMNLTWWKR